MKNTKHYLILNDNGTMLWTDPILAQDEYEAIEKATSLFQQLTPSQKKERKTFLLCEGYDPGDICGGYYEENDSEGAWIIEKEILSFIK